MAERRRVRNVPEPDDDLDRRSRVPDDEEEPDYGQDEAESGGDLAAAGADDVGDDATAAGQRRAAPARRRRSDVADRRGGRPRPPARRAMTVSEAAKSALEQIMELTAKAAESVTGVERTEDGWRIGIEVIEDRRIPSSADILATYQADIDDEGELVSYRRVRRYPRGRGDTSEES